MMKNIICSNDLEMINNLFKENYLLFKKTLDYESNITNYELKKLLKEIVACGVSNCLDYKKYLEKRK